MLALLGVSASSAAQPARAPTPAGDGSKSALAPPSGSHARTAVSPAPLPTGDAAGAGAAPQAPSALALSPAISASGPVNACCIDDFNRPDEDPLSQGGAWSPNDPRGSGNHDLLEVSSERAANLDTPEGDGTLSYRFQDFPNPFELYATVAAKPADNHNVHLNFNLRQLGSYSWDGYYLTWRALSGTDELRLIWCQDNTTCFTVKTAAVEMSAGDKFMVRVIGSHMEGWVYQGGAWSKKIDVDDSTFTGTKIGAGISGITPAGSNPARLDDYGGGPLPAPPPEQSIGTCAGSGTHAQSGSTCAAEPVNTLTGAYTTQVTDLQLPGLASPSPGRGATPPPTPPPAASAPAGRTATPLRSTFSQTATSSCTGTRASGSTTRGSRTAPSPAPAAPSPSSAPREVGTSSCAATKSSTSSTRRGI